MNPQPKSGYRVRMGVNIAIIEEDKNTLPRQQEYCKLPHKVGETLFIREPYYAYGAWFTNGFLKSGRPKWEFRRFDIGDPIYFSDTLPSNLTVVKGRHAIGWYLRSPLFLEAKHARSFIQVTDVRSEKLLGISFEDCLEEGIVHTDFWPIPGDSEAMKRFDAWAEKQPSLDNEPDEDKQNEAISTAWTEYARQAYFSLWDSINPKHPSKDNPWEWAYTFKLPEVK
jgi:hypothetical protein